MKDIWHKISTPMESNDAGGKKKPSKMIVYQTTKKNYGSLVF